MARSNANQQVERGLLSPNTAGTLMGFSPNSVRGWIKKGHLRRIKLPFTSDIQVSALELLMMAVRWSLPFNNQLFEAAKNYVRNFESPHISDIELFEVYYNQITQQQNGHTTKQEFDSIMQVLLKVSTKPLPTISSSKEHH